MGEPLKSLECRFAIFSLDLEPLCQCTVPNYRAKPMPDRCRDLVRHHIQPRPMAVEATDEDEELHASYHNTHPPGYGGSSLRGSSLPVFYLLVSSTISPPPGEGGGGIIGAATFYCCFLFEKVLCAKHVHGTSSQSNQHSRLAGRPSLVRCLRRTSTASI